VPVIVKEAASRELLELALVENLQREDLNAIEEATAYQRLAGEFGLTQDEIANRVGRSRAAVANTMRLLALSDEIRQSVAASAITEGHARALLAIEDEAARRVAWQEVIDGNLTVRQTEQLAHRSPTRANGAGKGGSHAAVADPETDQLEARVRDALGTKVELRRQKNGHGRLVLHFFSDDELSGLLSRIGVAAE
jgi:ParB family chromosome partitioning protein